MKLFRNSEDAADSVLQLFGHFSVVYGKPAWIQSSDTYRGRDFNVRTPALQLWKRFVEEGVSTKEGTSLKAWCRHCDSARPLFVGSCQVVGRVEDLDKHEVPESFKRGAVQSVFGPKVIDRVTAG